ncbi:MAG: vWA domain-containing protein [Desulfatibacillaceae bacterium]
MQHILRILACTACLLLLGACDDGANQQAGASRPTQSAPKVQKESPEPASFTVALAKNAVWPPPADSKVEEFDSVLTRQNFMAVLDMSGSMGESECSGSYGTKAAAARAALSAWLEGVPREANVGLVVFSGNTVELKVPLGVDNRDMLRQAVNATYPGGGTPLRTSMAMAYKELERRARHQNGYGDYRLVVITDGQHSEGENPRSVVDGILGNPANPVQIYTIGFCVANSALNQPGRVVYQSANNPEELRQGLDRVLAESTHFTADAIKEFPQDAK